MEYPVRTLQQLAHTLRGQRKAKHKTQAQAGAEVGVLPKTISALESSPGSRSVESLFKVLSALDLEIVLRPKNRTPSSGDSTTPQKAEW